MTTATHGTQVLDEKHQVGGWTVIRGQSLPNCEPAGLFPQSQEGPGASLWCHSRTSDPLGGVDSEWHKIEMALPPSRKPSPVCPLTSGRGRCVSLCWAIPPTMQSANYSMWVLVLCRHSHSAYLASKHSNSAQKTRWF